MEEQTGKPEKSAADRVRLVCMILGIAVWGAFILYCVMHRDEISLAMLLDYTPENPWLAALILILLFGLKSMSMVFAVDLLYAACGILFPLPLALLVGMCGTAVMVSLPYFIARRTGKAAAERIVRRYPKAAKLKEMRTGSDFWLVLLVRMFGVLPADPVSMFFGADGVRYGEYLPACLFGFLPELCIMAVLGMNAANPLSPEFISAAGLKIAFSVISVIAGAGIIRHGKKTEKTEISPM